MTPQEQEEILEHIAQIDAQKRPAFSHWLNIVSPTWVWSWKHLTYIQERLKDVADGKIKKLMLFVPPRHGKSELTTVRFSAWWLENRPESRVIIGAYNQTLANKFSRKIFKIASPRVTLNKKRTAVEDWETEAGGGLRAVGVGGGITGMGGDLIIIDDPVKNREEANSETYREKVWDWYTDDLYTRMEPGAAIILIMTRWHEDDLAGRILASDDAPNWTVIKLPAEAEEDDPLGRLPGEALCPERYDVDALHNLKTVMGSSYQALFQQRPAAAEGEIFKRQWWNYYKNAPRFSRIYQSWDTAFKAKQENDYSVCTTWGVADNGYYLIDVWKGRIEFPELKRMVLTLASQFNPMQILVEDKASGQSLIQELKRDTRLPIKPIKVDKDKIARAYAVSPEMEAGNVYLLEDAAWLRDYIDEMSAFPNSAHDDAVDSTTQALSEMILFRREPARWQRISVMGR